MLIGFPEKDLIFIFSPELETYRKTSLKYLYNCLIIHFNNGLFDVDLEIPIFKLIQNRTR